MDLWTAQVPFLHQPWYLHVPPCLSLSFHLLHSNHRPFQFPVVLVLPLHASHILGTWGVPKLLNFMYNHHHKALLPTLPLPNARFHQRSSFIGILSTQSKKGSHLFHASPTSSGLALNCPSLHHMRTLTKSLHSGDRSSFWMCNLVLSFMASMCYYHGINLTLCTP